MTGTQNRIFCGLPDIQISDLIWKILKRNGCTELKKYIICLLILIIAFYASACSNSTETTETKSEEKEQQTQATEEIKTNYKELFSKNKGKDPYERRVTEDEDDDYYYDDDEDEETEEEIDEDDDSDAWKKVLTNYLKNNGNDDYYEYALVDINGDYVPELYEHSKKKPSMSKLSWIYDGEVYSVELYIDSFEYIEGENMFMTTGMDSGLQGDFVYEIYKDEAEELTVGTANRMVVGQEFYVWNDEKVEGWEYDRLREEAFDSAHAKTVDLFLNTSRMIAEIQDI